MKIDDSKATAELLAELKKRGGTLETGITLAPPEVPDSFDIPEGKFSDLIHDSGLLVRNGKPMFAYIRDHAFCADVTGPAGRRKVHFAYCRTLRKMREEKRFVSRYRATNNRTGKFLIDIPVGGNETEEARERLYPCQNCLQEISYCDFDDLPDAKRDKIVREFDFDKAYELLWTIYRYHNAEGAEWPFDELRSAGAPTGYPPNWRKFAYGFRKSKGFTCKCCEVVASKFTDVHHIDGDKRNIAPTNLQCLCKLCHAARHTHYAVILNEHARTAIRRLRKAQGKPKNHTCGIRNEKRAAAHG